MSDINKQARDKLKSAAAKAADNFDPNMFVETRDVLALLDELEAAENRIAELEAREVVVNLPAYVDGRTLGYGEVNHMIDLCADAIEKAGHAAGIITKVGE